MVDSAIRTLAETHDLGEAWKALFPGIDSSSTIAIKVNCINRYLSSHPEVAYAVAEGLKKMSFGGNPFPENNIIIFDRTDSELQRGGYTLNTSSTGIRVFGTDSSGVGYSSETYDVNGITQRLSRIVTEMADYLIDISVLKYLSVSGVTLCLKNHYGTCDRPGSLHGNHCDPYIPALNALLPIQGKQCVNICDALFGIYSGGSVPQFAPNKIIMSQDVVAADFWGRKILEDKGSAGISDAHHIDTAAQPPYNLGTNDPSQMVVVEILEPTPVKETSWGSIKNLFRQE
jgi:uncharacterized protein (DUF362 family)